VGLFAGQAARSDPPNFPQFHSPNRGAELRFSISLADKTPFALTLDVTGPKASAAFDVKELISTVRHGEFRELGSQALKLGRIYVPKSVVIPVAGAVVLRNSARDGNLYRNIADLASQQAFQQLGCVTGKAYADQVSCNNAVDLTYALMGIQNTHLTELPTLHRGRNITQDEKTVSPCSPQYSVMATKCSQDFATALAYSSHDPFAAHLQVDFSSRPSPKSVPVMATLAAVH
jgi:hypothetical protein